MIIEPDIIWFEEDEYIGAKLSFPSGSVWRLDSKIREHGYYETRADVEEMGIHSEARAVFFCSKVSGDGPSTAVIKIRLQIPWFQTVTKKLSIRAQQATAEIPASFQREVDALSFLTKACCSSTPSLLDWKKDKQTDDEWVPGGYKLSMLLERLPGSDPSDLFFTGRMPRPERDALRAAFKAAWLETVHCGRVHEDEAMRNLLWDKQGNKCYLVDWEHWSIPDKKTVWVDHIYIGWNLAQSGPSDDLSDMSAYDRPLCLLQQFGYQLMLRVERVETHSPEDASFFVA